MHLTQRNKLALEGCCGRRGLVTELVEVLEASIRNF